MYSNLNNKQRLTNEQTLTMPNFVYRNNPKKTSQSCRPEILKNYCYALKKVHFRKKFQFFLRPTKILIHLCILLLHYCSSMSEMLHVFIVVYMPNKNHNIYKGPSLNDVRSLGGRGVSKNLTLLNKISKFYTIKV